MAITSLKYERVSPLQVRFFWTSNLSDPTYYVWVNGVLVGETLETEWLVSVGLGDQVQFSVFDDSSSVPPEYYPAQAKLRWLGRDGSSVFRVEQKVSGEWELIGLPPFRLSNVYQHVTGPLDDVTTYEFRVVPVDEDGRLGTTLDFALEMVRYPDSPEQTMQFTGGELAIT